MFTGEQGGVVAEGLRQTAGSGPVRRDAVGVGGFVDDGVEHVASAERQQVCQVVAEAAAGGLVLQQVVQFLGPTGSTEQMAQGAHS